MPVLKRTAMRIVAIFGVVSLLLACSSITGPTPSPTSSLTPAVSVAESGAAGKMSKAVVDLAIVTTTAPPPHDTTGCQRVRDKSIENATQEGLSVFVTNAKPQQVSLRLDEAQAIRDMWLLTNMKKGGVEVGGIMHLIEPPDRAPVWLVQAWGCFPGKRWVDTPMGGEFLEDDNFGPEAWRRTADWGTPVVAVSALVVETPQVSDGAKLPVGTSSSQPPPGPIASATLPNEPASMPTVKAGDGRADGASELDLASIRGIVQTSTSQLTYCYETRLESNANITGQIDVVLELDSGRIVAAQVLSNTTGDQDLAACVVGKIKRWTGFPPESKSTVHWPFVFTREEVSPRPRGDNLPTDPRWGEWVGKGNDLETWLGTGPFGWCADRGVEVTDFGPFRWTSTGAEFDVKYTYNGRPGTVVVPVEMGPHGPEETIMPCPTSP